MLHGPHVRETACCPPFDREAWDGALIVWKDRLFLKVPVKTVFYVPLDMGRKIARARAQLAGAAARVEGGLMLMQHRSPWNMDLYIDVARDVPGADIVTLGGTFMSKVFEGGYSDAGRFAGEMQEHVEASGRRMRKLYYAWGLCPKCARAVGRNSCVLFAEV